VLSGRSLLHGPIPRTEESYGVCVCVIKYKNNSLQNKKERKKERKKKERRQKDRKK